MCVFSNFKCLFVCVSSVKSDQKEKRNFFVFGTRDEKKVNKKRKLKKHEAYERELECRR